ncbi:MULTISPECIES: hypothetical protein [unclassified Microcoleus]|uniref:hypothetical protein n=1 Tax=unclassified Microcoleus TaxID=2642155 RepID=UPI0025D1C0C7|nr:MULTISPECIES: hypothetical protein [unclassified Microcoleus]
MTSLDDCPNGRSQFLTLESKDKIVIDRETFRRIFLSLGHSVDILSFSCNCDIFLTSLDNYLVQTNTPEASKSLLLLNHWLDVVPSQLEETLGELEETWQVMSFILAASNTGVSHD